jgi:hypothetical protein
VVQHPAIGAEKGKVVEVIKGENITIPANMLDLFHQFMASIANKEVAKENIAQPAEVMIIDKHKQEHEEPAKDVAESSTQGEARGNAAMNIPYCYRCLTRGHVTEECNILLFRDICESSAHVKGRCPLLKKAKNMYAMTCGYAIDGLGFYYIPHSQTTQSRAEARAALIQVIEGELSSTQVQSQMQRLVPSQIAWKIEELGKNRFKTIFPSKGEMNRMIEWGIVQTKDCKAKL